MANEDAVRAALDGINALYTKNQQTLGTTPQSVGWRDENTQILRFDKLAQVIRPDATPITVNDWGCGYAAMFPYLDKINDVTLAHYYGYDISTDMLDAAHKFVNGDVRAELIQSPDVTQEADYTFVSGTFNVRMEADDGAWIRYIEDKLLKLAQHSRRGLAFNLLTTYVDWKQENLYYADPFHFFDFCKRNISRYVSLLHDYPLYEWTMLVVK